MKIICRIFGHKIEGDNFHGHYCSRCEWWFDYGILEKYCLTSKEKIIIIPKFGEITKEDLIK